MFLIKVFDFYFNLFAQTQVAPKVGCRALQQLIQSRREHTNRFLSSTAQLLNFDVNKTNIFLFV